MNDDGTKLGEPVEDAIDSAIAAAEAKGMKPDELTQLIANVKLVDGRQISLNVPMDFGPDEFETCVGLLMQLRVASDQRKAALQPPAIVTPDRPKLLGLDGVPLPTKKAD